MPLPLCAQDMNPHRITVGVGSAAPGDSVYMDPGIGVELNYGYRFARLFQMDAGFETSFNKDYRNYYPKYGTGLTTSTNFFVPAGARLLIPVKDGRIEPSVGLGAVTK